MFTIGNGYFFDNFLEGHVPLSLGVETWEKILKQIKEDSQILCDNFRGVEIPKCSHEDGIFSQSRFSTLHVTSDDEYGFNGTETPIIMSSLGQKIFTEIVQGEELLGKWLGSLETFSHEHVLHDHSKIRNDDINVSEEILKILRKLLSTNVTRIHSNECTASGIKGNLLFLEDESSFTSENGVTNLFELGGTYREYLSSKSVELIEAYPSSGSSDTSKDVSHSDVVHLIGTVEYVTRFSEGICQILSRFCLTSTGWTSGSTSHLHVKSLGSCYINSISERSNNESRTIAKILITIGKNSISNSELEVFFTGIEHTLELSLPLEFIRTSNTLVNELKKNISGVGVHCNHAHDFLSSGLVKITLDQHNKSIKIFELSLVSIFNGVLVATNLSERFFTTNNPRAVINK
jgi:hypothetical protein